MKICQSIFVTLFICASPALFAQVMGNYQAQQQQTNAYQNVNFTAQFRGVPKSARLIDDTHIEISVNALANRRADAYTAIFSIIQMGKTAEETDNLINARINGFLSGLQALGINERDYYVDMVNFLPRYEYDVNKKLFSKKTYTEIPKGFEMQKNVHVRYINPGLLDDIVSAAAKQEIYDIVKVDYFVKDPTTVYKALREASFAYLNEIKKEYEKLHIALDSAWLITAENAWVAYPANRYESYQAFSSQALDQSEKAGAIVSGADKPIARFYNAIPANDYDIVLDPEILEPAAQFSFNLIARFRLKAPKVAAKPQKEIWLLTPTGDLKPVKTE